MKWATVGFSIQFARSWFCCWLTTIVLIQFYLLRMLWVILRQFANSPFLPAEDPFFLLYCPLHHWPHQSAKLTKYKQQLLCQVQQSLAPVSRLMVGKQLQKKLLEGSTVRTPAGVSYLFRKVHSGFQQKKSFWNTRNVAWPFRVDASSDHTISPAAVCWGSHQVICLLP